MQIPRPYPGESFSGGDMGRAREGLCLTWGSCERWKEPLGFLCCPQESRSQILFFPGPLDCHSFHQWVPLKQEAGGRR